MNNKILLRYMKDKGYNTTKLAEVSGLSVSAVNKIVYGVTTNPTIDNLQAIAKALGCTLDDLINDDRIEEPKTLAAHADEEDWSPEEQEDLDKFKAYLRSKRNK